MTAWTVFSRTDRTRWVNHQDGRTTADPVTRRALADPDLTYPLTPTGPIRSGIADERDLYAAAMHLVPAPMVAGTPPGWPEGDLGDPDGVVH
ncbi:hypothetical protein GQ85_11050 [Rhodococcus rhodochrous]|nr:hypothetical protein GQ85_11050 [Rhodococcus rhodochrous]